MSSRDGGLSREQVCGQNETEGEYCVVYSRVAWNQTILFPCAGRPVMYLPVYLHTYKCIYGYLHVPRTNIVYVCIYHRTSDSRHQTREWKSLKAHMHATGYGICPTHVSANLIYFKRDKGLVHRDRSVYAC